MPSKKPQQRAEEAAAFAKCVNNIDNEFLDSLARWLLEEGYVDEAPDGVFVVAGNAGIWWTLLIENRRAQIRLRKISRELRRTLAPRRRLSDPITMRLAILTRALLTQGGGGVDDHISIAAFESINKHVQLKFEGHDLLVLAVFPHLGRYIRNGVDGSIDDAFWLIECVTRDPDAFGSGPSVNSRHLQT